MFTPFYIMSSLRMFPINEHLTKEEALENLYFCNDEKKMIVWEKWRNYLFVRVIT